MGDHTSLETVGPIQQPLEVREDGVDTGHVVGEQLTTVQHHNSVVDFKSCTVPANFT
tara:strand:- start:572 stop:742 length:171 start_codon:yes stop_codon:yes gene_type:complete